MKKLISVAMCLCISACVAACGIWNRTKAEDAEATLPPEPDTPSAAVAGLIDCLKDVDAKKAGDYVTGKNVNQYIGSEYFEALRGVLGRLEYSIIDERSQADSAQVDVVVTAVDLNGVAASMLMEFGKQLALAKLTGGEVDAAAFVKEYFADKIDPESLSTVDTEATVYLVKDGGGRWKVDLDNEENMDFLNALTGGFVKTLQSLRDLIVQYGL